MTIKRLNPQRDLVGLDKKNYMVCFALLALFICTCIVTVHVITIEQSLVMYANQVQGYVHLVCVL